MLKINHDQWFDLNNWGLILVAAMMLMSVLFDLNFLTIVLVEVFLFSCGLYLFVKITKNKNMNLILNPDNKWFVQLNNEMIAVELQDYWLQTGRIFIWLKGSKKSVSLMLSRSIIGAEAFSQLRSKIL